MSDEKTVPDGVTLYRAAVRGVRRCLELSEEKPKWIDTLCNGFLDIVNCPDPEGQLKRFRDSAKPLADGDLYMTAILKALDTAKSEEEAEFWVIQSVNEQLLVRNNDRARSRRACDQETMRTFMTIVQDDMNGGRP